MNPLDYKIRLQQSKENARGSLSMNLQEALSQPFPIQGWFFEADVVPNPDKHVYYVYECKPEFDEKAQKVLSTPAGEIVPADVKLRGVFKITPHITLLGQTIETTPQGIADQIVHVNVAQKGFRISVEAKKAFKPEVEFIMPEHSAFTALGSVYVRKRLNADSQEMVNKATHVLAQMHRIKENYLGEVQRSLGAIGQLISKRGRYWDLVTDALSGVLDPKKLPNMSYGVISITPISESIGDARPIPVQ